LFAGLTVLVAILGLAFSGVPFVGWMGVAVAIVIAVSVLSAITLLPAVLTLLGRRVDSLRIPWRVGVSSDAAWMRWSRRIGRRPGASLAGGLAVLILLACPVSEMRLGILDDGSSPPDSTQHVAYTWVAAAFGPGMNCPLTIVVASDRSPAGEVTRQVIAMIADDPDIVATFPAAANRDGSVALVTVIPRAAQEDPATSRLVHRLRDGVVPAIERDTGATLALGGLTPLTIDLDEAVGAHLIAVVAAVLLASFALLVVVFRSVLVPLKAVVLNLLSIAAAYGVVVVVFQYGLGAQLIGLAGTTPIISFVPLLMFAILFGLSMDYEVFMLTRIREAHARGESASASVSIGLEKTGRVVSSAALIMISVFVSFALGADPVLKMFGVGLAAAVAIDASIVRLLLVPASMILLGNANWWLPRWLERLLPAIASEARMNSEATDDMPRCATRESASVTRVALRARKRAS
jgi:RND superfamily putative drug exporter